MSEKFFLFLDTETTGFKKKGGLIQEGQARVCQLALVLTDDQGRSIAEFCSYIKPDGWVISEGAQKVHGITMEKCEKFGLSMSAVFMLYKRFAEISSHIVAHNSEFDAGMMDIEEGYFNHRRASFANINVNTPWLCTMKSHSQKTGEKWPKLDWALEHYCNRKLGDGAHDAMQDAKACRDIFFAMRGVKVAA